MANRIKKTLAKTIHERVKRRRIELNILTQEELSQLSGLSQESISQIESGKYDNMKRDTMEKLAKALGVDFNFFMLVDNG